MKARIIPKTGRTLEFGGENPISCDPKVLRRATHAIIMETQKIPQKGNPFGPFTGQDGKYYEIAYESKISNCVAFAMHIDYNAKNSAYYVPGWLSAHKIPRNFKEVCEYMIADFNALGRKVHQVIWAEQMPEKLPVAPKGQYWLKCLDAGKLEIAGMHWMCKDEASGLWFHKVGWYSPPKVVERIINPVVFNGILYGGDANYETEDTAGYTSYSDEGIVHYKPIFVMLVDE